MKECDNLVSTLVLTGAAIPKLLQYSQDISTSQKYCKASLSLPYGIKHIIQLCMYFKTNYQESESTLDVISKLLLVVHDGTAPPGGVKGFYHYSASMECYS